MKVDGKKTASDGPSHLDQITTKRLYNDIKDHLSEYLMPFAGKTVNEANRCRVDKITNEFLRDMVHKRALNEASVYTEIKYVGWKDLYPKFTTRMGAYLTYALCKIKVLDFVYTGPTIMNQIFTYEHTNEVYLDRYMQHMIDEYTDGDEVGPDFIIEHVAAHPLEPIYRARLKVPYEYIQADVSVQPIKPVDFVTIKVSISPTPAEESA